MTLLFVLLAYAVFAQNDPKAKEILIKQLQNSKLTRSRNRLYPNDGKPQRKYP